MPRTTFCFPWMQFTLLCLSCVACECVVCSPVHFVPLYEYDAKKEIISPHFARAIPNRWLSSLFFVISKRVVQWYVKEHKDSRGRKRWTTLFNRAYVPSPLPVHRGVPSNGVVFHRSPFRFHTNYQLNPFSLRVLLLLLGNQFLRDLRSVF